MVGDLLTGDEPVSTFDEEKEQLHGRPREALTFAHAAQFIALHIQFVALESQHDRPISPVWE